MKWYPAETYAHPDEHRNRYWQDTPPPLSKMNFAQYLARLLTSRGHSALEAKLKECHDSTGSWDFLYAYDQLTIPPQEKAHIDSLTSLILTHATNQAPLTHWGPHILEEIKAHPLVDKLIQGIQAEQDYSTMTWAEAMASNYNSSATIPVYKPLDSFMNYNSYYPTTRFSLNAHLSTTEWSEILPIAIANTGFYTPFLNLNTNYVPTEGDIFQWEMVRRGSALLLQTPQTPKTRIEEAIVYRIGRYLNFPQERHLKNPENTYLTLLANILEYSTRIAEQGIPRQTPSVYDPGAPTEALLRKLFHLGGGQLSKALPYETQSNTSELVTMDTLFYALKEEKTVLNKIKKSQSLLPKEEIGEKQLQGFVNQNTPYAPTLHLTPAEHNRGILADLNKKTQTQLPPQLKGFPDTLYTFTLTTPQLHNVPMLIRRSNTLSLEFCIPVTTRTQNTLLTAYGEQPNSLLRPLTGPQAVFNNLQLMSQNPQEFIIDLLSATSTNPKAHTLYLILHKAPDPLPLVCTRARTESIYTLLNNPNPNPKANSPDNTFVVFEMALNTSQAKWVRQGTWPEYFRTMEALKLA